MPPLSRQLAELPGPELLNAHCSQTLDSVSQAALCQACHLPERRSLSSLLAKAKAPKNSISSKGLTSVQKAGASHPPTLGTSELQREVSPHLCAPS